MNGNKNKNSNSTSSIVVKLIMVNVLKDNIFLHYDNLEVKNYNDE